jgi:hypothetical protein
MSAPTRVRTYDGIVESQAEVVFRADAAEAARHGWSATDRRWDGTQLRVVYTRTEPAPAPGPGPGPVVDGETAARGYPWTSRERLLVPVGFVVLVLWLALALGPLSSAIRFQVDCIRIQWSEGISGPVPTGCPDLRFPRPNFPTD